MDTFGNLSDFLKHLSVTDHVNGIQLDQVEEYVYLGQRFTSIEENQDNEIGRRTKAGWQAFGRQHSFKGYTTNMLKRKGSSF